MCSRSPAYGGRVNRTIVGCLVANLADRENARHEAAHAVVAVRLRLPIQTTDIESRPMTDVSGHGLPNDLVVTTGGLTRLAEGTIDAWIPALPDAEARKMVEAHAVMLAAGVVAEIDRGSTAHDVRC